MMGIGQNSIHMLVFSKDGAEDLHGEPRVGVGRGGLAVGPPGDPGGGPLVVRGGRGPGGPGGGPR